MGVERSTFLINKEGILIEEFRKVRVKGHIEKVLDKLKINKLKNKIKRGS